MDTCIFDVPVCLTLPTAYVLTYVIDIYLLREFNVFSQVFAGSLTCADADGYLDDRSHNAPPPFQSQKRANSGDLRHRKIYHCENAIYTITFIVYVTNTYMF